jgi:hypothetical protein
LESFAHGVVVRGSWRDPDVHESDLGEVLAKQESFVLGSVIGEHITNTDSEATHCLGDVVDEADRVGGGDGPDDQFHDRPAGAGVDGGELIHLPDAFEVADVEAVEGNQVTGMASPVTEPERFRLVLGDWFGDDPRERGQRGGTSDTLATPAHAVIVEDALHRRLANLIAELVKAISELATPDRRLDHRDSQQISYDVSRGLMIVLGRRRSLGHNASSP